MKKRFFDEDPESIFLRLFVQLSFRPNKKIFSLRFFITSRPLGRSDQISLTCKSFRTRKVRKSFELQYLASNALQARAQSGWFIRIYQVFLSHLASLTLTSRLSAYASSTSSTDTKWCPMLVNFRFQLGSGDSTWRE